MIDTDSGWLSLPFGNMDKIDEFDRYMQDIDEEFVKTFPHAETIAHWVFSNVWVVWRDEDGLAAFTPLIMRWLYKREDCPAWLREMLGKALDSETNLGLYPTWEEIGLKTGRHAKLSYCPGFKNARKSTHSKTGWCLDLLSESDSFLNNFYYNPYTNRIASLYLQHAEDLGVAFDGDGHVDFEQKSLKSVIKFIRKQSLPVGKKLRVYNKSNNSWFDITITA